MEIEEWAARLFTARTSGLAKPCCASDLSGVDEAMAYLVQAELVRMMTRHSPISGFKGALTGQAAQEAMGLKTPASGVLLAEMQWQEGSVIHLGDFNRPVLETEIGVVIARDIVAPITSEELSGYVDHYQPMVEIADIGVENPGSMTVFDFIAGNSAAAGYIAGKPSEIEDVNGVAVTFTKDGELLHEGRGSDALGDQARAALWLINQLVGLGYTLKQGHILMTGSLGRIQMTIAPGYYVADFESFGKIQFEVR